MIVLLFVQLDNAAYTSAVYFNLFSMSLPSIQQDNQPEYSNFYDFWFPLFLVGQYLLYSTLYESIVRTSPNEVAALMLFLLWSGLLLAMCCMGGSYAGKTKQRGLQRFYVILAIINSLAVCYCGFGALLMNDAPMPN